MTSSPHEGFETTATPERLAIGQRLKWGLLAIGNTCADHAKATASTAAFDPTLVVSDVVVRQQEATTRLGRYF